MTLPPTPTSTSHRPPGCAVALRRAVPRLQHGAVLLFTLIALVVMLIAAVALIRSFNTSLFSAGNMAFKRDVQNQADRVVPAVLALMQTGELSTTAARANNSSEYNYSAVRLSSNPQGIPVALLNTDTVFGQVGNVDNDVRVGQNNSITIRYLIDRQCNSTGVETLLGADSCVVSPDSAAPTGGSASRQGQGAEFGAAGADAAASSAGASAAPAGAGAGAPAVPFQVVYRLSVRVTGPRNTQAFFQTTFTTL